MAPLTEPVAPALAATLRRVVLDFCARERRRVFPPVLHVGRPDGLVATFESAPGLGLDHGLRVDVVAAMLSRHGDGLRAWPLCWLTRPGRLLPHDADLAWLSACTAAYAERARPATLVVVTRHGWYDPATGVRREWRRPRRR